jgi:hypothetical protein
VKRLPILRSRRPRVGDITAIPWSLVENPTYRERAKCNHDQTLERLAERGGLAPCELRAIVTGERWDAVAGDEAERWLLGFTEGVVDVVRA